MAQTYEYIEKVDKAINKLVPELVLDQLGLRNCDNVKCESLKVTAKDVQFGDLAQVNYRGLKPVACSSQPYG